MPTRSCKRQQVSAIPFETTVDVLLHGQYMQWQVHTNTNTHTHTHTHKIVDRFSPTRGVQHDALGRVSGHAVKHGERPTG
jgi:hypothetical protein